MARLLTVRGVWVKPQASQEVTGKMADRLVRVFVWHEVAPVSVLHLCPTMPRQHTCASRLLRVLASFSPKDAERRITGRRRAGVCYGTDARVEVAVATQRQTSSLPDCFVPDRCFF